MKDDQTSLFFAEEPHLGEVERWCRDQGQTLIVGVDEAGRGPLAGPVYAAAVALDLTDDAAGWLSFLDDSKALSATQREEAYQLIEEHALAFAISCADRDVIDAINILQATRRAMKAAVESVCRSLTTTPDAVYVDGNRPIEISLPQRCIVRGDARSLHIAAASILAKVTRDRVMLGHHETWPEYNFASNKGYGTAEHRRAIAEHGPCPIHRLSFGGVREHAHRLRE